MNTDLLAVDQKLKAKLTHSFSLSATMKGIIGCFSNLLEEPALSTPKRN